tara:strand:+ start:2874 stop:3698 length:825 start_codon:yes stop_codon:yes gene_type:complete
MARFILKQPIRFNDGVGFSITNGNEDIILRDNVTVTFNIGQDVSTDSDVSFDEVTIPLININDSTLRIADQSISGSLSVTGDLTISSNLVGLQSASVNGILTAGDFKTELSESITIFESGSTAFGDTLDDIHNLTGSLNTSGSIVLNGLSFNEISNTIVDGAATAIVTENALKNYVTEQTDDFQIYLRKSFAHTGSFVSATTQSFTAVTASSPTDLSATSVEDFMFFNNGAFMETDALSIKQSGNSMFLFVNTDSIGYDIDNDDEIVAFGKFNS